MTLQDTVTPLGQVAVNLKDASNFVSVELSQVGGGSAAGIQQGARNLQILDFNERVQKLVDILYSFTQKEVLKQTQELRSYSEILGVVMSALSQKVDPDSAEGKTLAFLFQEPYSMGEVWKSYQALRDADNGLYNDLHHILKDSPVADVDPRTEAISLTFTNLIESYNVQNCDKKFDYVEAFRYEHLSPIPLFWISYPIIVVVGRYVWILIP